MRHIFSNGPCVKYFNHTFVNTDIINIVITDIKIDWLGVGQLELKNILIIKFNNTICNIKLVNAVLPTFLAGFNHCRTIWRWYSVRGLVYGDEAKVSWMNLKKQVLTFCLK